MKKLLLVVVVVSTMIWHLAVAKVLSKWLISEYRFSQFERIENVV